MNHQDRITALRGMRTSAHQTERQALAALSRLRKQPKPFGIGIPDRQREERELGATITASTARAIAVTDCAIAVGVTPDELDYSPEKLTCLCGRHHPTLAARAACRDCRRIAERSPAPSEATA